MQCPLKTCLFPNGPISWPPVLLLAAFSRTAHPNNFTLDTAIHPPNVKSIGWTVVKEIEVQTYRDSFHFRCQWSICQLPILLSFVTYSQYALRMCAKCSLLILLTNKPDVTVYVAQGGHELKCLGKLDNLEGKDTHWCYIQMSRTMGGLLNDININNQM